MARKTKKPPIKIELTPEQQAQVRQATGREIATLELTPETLEERAAPVLIGGGGIGPAPGPGPVG